MSTDSEARMGHRDQMRVEFAVLGLGIAAHAGTHTGDAVADAGDD
jgi:hypothetical protein